MSLKRQFASGAIWMVAGTSFNQLSGFVVFVVLSRLLSPQQFGIVAFATLMVELARPVVSNGVSDAMIRRPEWSEDAAATAFWLNLALATAVALIVILVGEISILGGFVADKQAYQGLGLVLIVIAGTLILDSMASVPLAKLRREFAHRKVVMRAAITSVISGVAGIILAMAGWGVWALVMQRVVSSILVLVLTFLQAQWLPKPTFDKQEAKELGRFVTGLTSAQFLSNLNGQVAGLIIGFGVGPAALAQYRAGTRLMSLTTQLVISPIQQMALIAFSKIKDKANLPNAYDRLTGVCALVACPAFIGMGAVADDVVHLLFGKVWAAAAPVMQITSLVVGVSVINYFFTPALSSLGKTKGSVIYFASAIVGNAFFGALALPWGLAAVVASQVIRGYFGLPVSLLLLKREVGIRPFSLVGRVTLPFLCALGMGAIILFTRHYLLPDIPPILRVAVLVPLGAVSYALLMFFFGRSVLAANLSELEPIMPAFLRRHVHRWVALN